VDGDRLAVGGYSVGGPLATFTAARRSAFDAIVYWAPSPAPIWQGLNADALYPQVRQPSLFVLGELDDDAPAEGGYPDELQARTPESPVEEIVIEGASHHQFQQPTGADQFSNTPTITREEQQAIAIDETRRWLDRTLGVTRTAPAG
jgi:dienelactone hydrolase